MTPRATPAEKVCAATIAGCTLLVIVGTLRVGTPCVFDAILFLVSIATAAWAVDLWHQRRDHDQRDEDDGYGTGGYP